MGLKETILGIWGKEIAYQSQEPKLREVKVGKIGVTFVTCPLCKKPCGIQDLHDCRGLFDALRIAEGASTNSVRLRYRQKHGLTSNQKEELVKTAVQELGNMSTLEYNSIRTAYTSALQAIGNPDEQMLQLEESLWDE